jgi:2-desacetyl-2-hydroxyethyl bacteriochlorophyllide A dehydrogenase
MTSHLTMEALIYEAPGVMVMRRVPVPSPGPRDVLIRVSYSGICGSELSGFLGQSSLRTPPLVFGHEVSGVIVATGHEVRTLAIGDRVTVNPLVTCRTCPYCRDGREQLCISRRLLGASMPGGNADFVVVPADAVHEIPPGLSMESASMVEPLAFALNATEVSGDVSRAAAVVVGAGAIGLFVIQALRLRGAARILVVEVNPDRRALAVELGAVAAPTDVEAIPAWVRNESALGAPVVIDAVGSAVTRRLSLECVAAGGTVVLAGLHTDETELPLNNVVRSEISLRGAFAYSKRHFSEALELMSEGRAGLTSGVIVAPLADGQLWFERLVSGDPSPKVLLSPAQLDPLT